MSEEQNTADRLERVRAIMRDWETYKTEYDPEFARTYAGQRVAMHRGRVIAHGKVGSDVALEAPARDYPGRDLLRANPGAAGRALDPRSAWAGCLADGGGIARLSRSA
jgi:hypothetical protein